jgi:hypothetical protein
MEKKQILQPEKKYYQAPVEDQTVSIGLETREELLREGDKSIILDLERLFNKERNDSKKYKIYGKIRMIFRNMYKGESSYSNLREYLYLHGDGSDLGNYEGYLPYDEFAFLRRDIYRNVIDTPTGTTTSNFGTYTPTFSLPTQTPNKHQNISMMDAPYHNWNLYLTYVHQNDSFYPITYTLTGGTKTISGNVAANGIPCRVESLQNYYRLTCPVPHGINEGEYVIISGKTRSIASFGNEKFDSEKYVLNLSKAQFSGTPLSSIVLIKRCIDKDNPLTTTSIYYVHRHKVITKTTDYILDKAGFETPIFEEEKKLLFENSAGIDDFLVERNRQEAVLFDFRDEFVLTGLTNNLGYTPTEIYLSVIFRNGSGYFDYPVKVGYRFHLHDSWVDDHYSGTTANETALTSTLYPKSGTTATFYTGNTLTTGSTLTGAFVEYSPVEMKERIISEAFHKLTNPTDIFDYGQVSGTTYVGTSVNNKLGLYYQPHYRIKLRELSPYVETFNTDNILDLPDNAKYDPFDRLWKWRDIYDHGYIDPDGNGTDYPFVNGLHYVKSDINFYLRNEQAFKNKTDGIKDFNGSNIDC